MGFIIEYTRYGVNKMIQTFKVLMHTQVHDVSYMNSRIGISIIPETKKKLFKILIF